MTAHQAAATEGLAAGLRALDIPAPRPQNHAASLLALPNGDVLCSWFAGTQEGMSDISIWSSIWRRGSGAWSAPTQRSFDATRSEQNPIPYLTPSGQLELLYTAQIAGHQDTAIVRRRVYDARGLTWFEPTDLLAKSAVPGGVFVRHPPLFLASGDCLLPAYFCRARPGERWVGDYDSSIVLRSSDQGATWQVTEIPQSLGCVHMSLVRGLGDTLLGFFRSRYADWIYRTESHDMGKTWSAPSPTVLPNNNSSIQAIALRSGRLAIVFNASQADSTTARRDSLYDEIADAPKPALQGTDQSWPTATRRAFWGTPRAPLRVALSEDGGITWPWQRNIETGDGFCLSNNSTEQKNRELSYPSICQTEDGTIHVAYTHHRQRIRHVRLDEAWVMQTTRN